MSRRTAAGLLLAGLTLFLSGSGLLAAALHRVVLWAFDRLGVAVIALPGDRFVVDDRAFVVSFWCTPAVLWLGCLLLLRHSCPGLGRYLAWALGLMIAGAAAMAINIVLSIGWYVEGAAWGWAHRPGLVLIYSGFLVTAALAPGTGASAPAVVQNPPPGSAVRPSAARPAASRRSLARRGS